MSSTTDSVFFCLPFSSSSSSCASRSSFFVFFFFSSRRRHTRLVSDWSSDVCSSDLYAESATECALPDCAVRSTADGLLYAMDLKTTGLYITPDWQRQFEHSQQAAMQLDVLEAVLKEPRSEERRVGKEGRLSSKTVSV